LSGRGEVRSWLTVDTDDERHHPGLQGHPTRSRGGGAPVNASQRLLRSLEKFGDWLLAEPVRPVTLFLIADQLEDGGMRAALRLLFERSDAAGVGLTVACHGLSHRCWSAWEPDPRGFRDSLAEAKHAISDFAGHRYRPWFRAPAGYVAPWMAAELAAEGFALDSSINPTPFLRVKTGRARRWFPPRSNGWKAVRSAMEHEGIVERAWTTVGWPALPACGPALHIPLLGPVARGACRRRSAADPASEAELLDATMRVHTLYWHVLDHSRRSGRWVPPVG